MQKNAQRRDIRETPRRDRAAEIREWFNDPEVQRRIATLISEAAEHSFEQADRRRKH